MVCAVTTITPSHSERTHDIPPAFGRWWKNLPVYSFGVDGRRASLFAGAAIQGWVRSRERPVLALSRGAPSNPLFEYRTADSDLWSSGPAWWAGIVLSSHTHLPFQRTYAGKIVVHPGSVGQPRNGRAEACYAV